MRIKKIRNHRAACGLFRIDEHPIGTGLPESGRRSAAIDYAFIMDPPRSGSHFVSRYFRQIFAD
jgi:hypothetical protein